MDSPIRLLQKFGFGGIGSKRRATNYVCGPSRNCVKVKREDVEPRQLGPASPTRSCGQAGTDREAACAEDEARGA